MTGLIERGLQADFDRSDLGRDLADDAIARGGIGGGSAPTGQYRLGFHYPVPDRLIVTKFQSSLKQANCAFNIALGNRIARLGIVKRGLQASRVKARVTRCLVETQCRIIGRNRIGIIAMGFGLIALPP